MSAASAVASLLVALSDLSSDLPSVPSHAMNRPRLARVKTSATARAMALSITFSIAPASTGSAP